MISPMPHKIQKYDINFQSFLDSILISNLFPYIRKIIAAFGIKKNLLDRAILKLNLAYTSFKGKKINA